MLPPILVIFGISGDLSKRKLLPALYRLFSNKLLPEGMTIIGVSRSDLNIEELLSEVELCVFEKDNLCNPVVIKELKDAIKPFKLDPAKQSDYISLRHTLESYDGESLREWIFQIAVPAEAYSEIINGLGSNGLNDTRARLVIEKPFGSDVESSKKLISETNSYFKESQIFRTDHYLAKDTAQNILTFRKYNTLFNSCWSKDYIQSIHIKAYETLDVDNRVGFYDRTGALRDLVQSHLMQLLSLTIMEIPSEMTSDLIHENKYLALKQLYVSELTESVRGQYSKYTDNVEAHDSSTETYVKFNLRSQLERWEGVQFTLETGKALATKETTIEITFRSESIGLTNKLKLQLQPMEGIILDLIIKAPGLDEGLTHTALKFDYESNFGEDKHLEPYERVILDVIDGDQALFASSLEILESWRILQPLIDLWRADKGKPVTYEPRSKPEDIR